MLRNFLYINAPVLDGYLSSIEDGLRESADSRTSRSMSGGANLTVPIIDVGLKGSKGQQADESTSRRDTPNARFERLRALALSTPDASDWVIVDDPDEQLPHIERGSIVEMSCDAYVPDQIKMLASLGNIAGFASQVGKLSDLASSLNLDAKGLPDRSQVNALSKAADFSVEYAIVGEVEISDEWRLKAKLNQAYLLGDIDGQVTVVSKVVERWPKGEWRPLLELRGVNVVGRQQRRKLEKTRPAEDQVDNWLEGPALSLEVLAIYM